MKNNKKNSDTVLNIINVYNKENKTVEELKLLFNKKLLNMIYNLEKNSFYRCENNQKMV